MHVTPRPAVRCETTLRRRGQRVFHAARPGPGPTGIREHGGPVVRPSSQQGRAAASSSASEPRL